MGFVNISSGYVCTRKIKRSQINKTGTSNDVDVIITIIITEVERIETICGKVCQKKNKT